MWGNVQPSEAPWRLRWDLSSGSDWLPLFKGGSLPNPPSVQPADISMSSADTRAAGTLKERLERSLRCVLLTL